MVRRRAGLLLLLVLLFFSSCASISKIGMGTRPTENYSKIEGDSQVGVASWYGVDEDGGKTASGERFSKNSYTAAHQTLPIGTMARVVNLENGRDAIVKINDRGPFKKGRIIDLSYAAAKSIEMLGKGTAKVRVEVISIPGRKSDYFDAKYTVQVGSFKDKQDALGLKEQLDGSLSDVRIEPTDLEGEIYYRIRIGRFSQRDEAEDLAAGLRRSGYTGSVIEE
jgi:peptidoglycan lytic transglycosylase